MNIKPIILCGGSGTRLWPESRKKLPKQFIKFFKNNSLLDLTLKRVKSISNENSPIIVSNEEYRFHINKSLEKQSIQGTCIHEPIERSTTASIYISAKFSKISDELIFIPSDHFIKNEVLFKQTIEKALREKTKMQWIIIGIKPNEPNTGYGYIKTTNDINDNKFLKKVLNFTEKPNLKTANYYIKNNYLWNAGIFIGNAKMIIKSIQEYAPDVAKQCDIVIKNARLTLDKKNVFFDLNDFKKIPSISIDYSVIEKAKNVYCALSDFDWDDLGNWDNLIKYKNNYTSNNKIVQIDSKNNYIKSKNKVIATIGIKNTIIVDTNDALLISKKGKSEDVKK